MNNPWSYYLDYYLELLQICGYHVHGNASRKFVGSFERSQTRSSPECRDFHFILIDRVSFCFAIFKGSLNKSRA